MHQCSEVCLDGQSFTLTVVGVVACADTRSWSRSGRLLASGSDDQYVNIYSYQSESSNAPFELNTTLFTGHRANIFSVKFMPHSNDGTLVTCAADSTVRVFDIEYSGGTANSASQASARSRRMDQFFATARYLNPSNTNAKIYRSHADRVKRIVTESSPYLFLTCSEDGEVRQWDLRLPSSAYPAPRGGQGFMSYRPGLRHDDSNVPPPLISYKAYNLDINTISCSPSQPHYIALGGAHMHCFLHDRRMAGSDTFATGSSATPSAGSAADEEMNKATRCVRRFAPGGKHHPKHAADGHITACKISDAHPNEMVVSWSGDHIYAFDLIHSPDAREGRVEKKSNGKDGRPRCSSRSRKRKRRKPVTPSSQGSGGRHQSRRRSEEPDTFRVHYENGEEEDIPMPTFSHSVSDTAENILEQARYAVLSDAQRLSMEIAKGLVKLRKTLFSLELTVREAIESEEVEPESYTACFSSALEIASENLPKMHEVMRQWSYPMNPSPETVAFQQSLRRNRQSSWRFVQASGALAYALSNEPLEPESAFQTIVPAPGEDGNIDPGAQFCYEFIRAILLWLQGGRNRLLKGFQRHNTPRRLHERFPIPDGSQEDAIETILIPYLMQLARDIPVINIDASRFEHDSSIILFPTQRAAVTAFGNIAQLPLEDLGGSAARYDRRGMANPSPQVRSLDRASAKRFWLLKVARGLLMEAGNGVNYMFVNNAFGGLRTISDTSDSESEAERNHADTVPNVEEEEIQRTELVRRGSASRRVDTGSDNQGEAVSPNRVNEDDSESNPDQTEADSSGENDDDDDEDEDVDAWPLGSSSNEDTTFDDSDDTSSSSFAIPKVRQEKVEPHAPCSTHIRSYRGHCNVKTVKDVNYYGLDDEYVVSGSDSGHIFIWDRKTSSLVNILEGDSDVVNVVQGLFILSGEKMILTYIGHPYEPMIAASGIDNTIKIFSSDQNAQEDARNGINILDPDNPSNTRGRNTSSIGGLESKRRIHESYRIMSQNDVERRGGVNEAHITVRFFTLWPSDGSGL